MSQHGPGAGAWGVLLLVATELVFSPYHKDRGQTHVRNSPVESSEIKVC